MADAPAPPSPPVAIRITRPYGTEDEYLDAELETLTRAGITLLGAQSRPQGVVLRFELCLTSGYVVMRGEGRVLGFKANAFAGLGGLTLRFTRLDTRSKALIDKAVALRERRRPSSRPPDPLEPYLPRPSLPEIIAVPAPSEPTLPLPPTSSPSLQGGTASLPIAIPETTVPAPPLVLLAAAGTAPVSAPAPESALAPAPAPISAPTLESAPALASAPISAPIAAPADRDSLLERLRSRAKSLDAGDVQRILGSSARRRA